MRYTKYLALVFLCLFCVSCTNSKWLISIFYNRLDNRILSEINSYADFKPEQSKEIKERVQRFHHWHRTTQLPIYAELLQSIAKQMSAEEDLGFNHIESWAEDIEKMAENTNNCHPMMFSFELMKNLDDAQVEQARAHMLEEYAERRERYEDRSEEKRTSKRRDKTLVWLKRIKFDLNTDELVLLDESFADQIDLAEPAFALWKDWDSHFYELLLSRMDPSFEDNARAHIYHLESMLEENYPTEVQTNREIWRTFFYQITLDESQNTDSKVPKFLEKLAKNLSAISLDVPRSQASWNASEYCP